MIRNRARRWSRLLGWRLSLCLLLLVLPGLLLADRPLSSAAENAPDDPYPYGFIDQARGTYFLIQLTATEPDYGYFSVALPGIGLLTNTAPAQVAASDPAAVQVTYDGAAVLDGAAILDPVSTVFTRLSGQRSPATIQLTATLNPAAHTATVALTYNGQQYTVSALPPAHTAEPVFTQVVTAFAQQDWAQMYGLLDRQWQASETQADFVAGLNAGFPAFGTLTNVQVLAAPDYLTAREGYAVATGLVALTFTANGTSSVQWNYITLVADGGQWKLYTFVPVPADTLAVTPGGPYTVVAGQSVALAATAINPAGGTLTYAWDLDGDGSFETPGQNATFSAAGLQAPASRTIGVQATNGAGQTATAQTTVTVTAASAALAFNGVNQDVEVPDSPDLHITTNLTLEAWIKPSVSPPDHRHLVGKNTYELAVEPDGNDYHAVFDFASGGVYHTITSGPLPLTQWAHLAGTYDGSTMRLFVNGTLVASQAVSGDIDQTTQPLRIGSADATGDFFAGTIDEVRLSHVVRYTATFPTPAAPFSVDANTVGLWHLDEGSGTTTADATGHGHSGTLVNGPVWTTGTSFTTPRLLVGTPLVPAYLDTNAAGSAEAFQYTATATGSATALTVYLDRTSTATQVVVGLYSNAAGDVPGTLLAQTTITSPVAGAWNTVTLPGVAITAGSPYWLAVLGPVGAGTVQFRDTPTEAGGDKSQTSAQSNLTTLPATWTPGTSYINSPLAAYATAAP